MSILHRGPWNQISRQSPALKFLEKHFATVDALDFDSSPSSKFYAPNAIFHDTKGDVYISGPNIWNRTKRLLAPFSKVRHEVVEIRVISTPNEKDTVYAEFVTHFRLKGDESDVVAPRLFIFTISEAESPDATDGLQIHDMSLFWDTSILGRYVTEKKRREERSRLKRSRNSPDPGPRKR